MELYNATKDNDNDGKSVLRQQIVRDDAVTLCTCVICVRVCVSRVKTSDMYGTPPHGLNV